MTIKLVGAVDGFNKCMLLGILLFQPAGPTLVAQSGVPKPAAMLSGIVAPKDVDYPGLLRVAVDATDLDRHIFDVRQTIPVTQAGPMTLLYPKWVPGTHSPLRNTVHLMAGLAITANGQPVPWVRDQVEMTAFHVEVPDGVRSLELRFQFLSSTDAKIGRVVMTPAMLNLQWWSTAFYPAGHFVSRIRVEPSVKLPQGWGFGCALATNSLHEGWIRFKPTTFETLVDSPLFAGRHFRQVNLSDPGEVPVRMSIVADSDELLEISPEALAAHRQLVVQARQLFGSQPYEHYDFLVALSDQLGGIGLEHHQSSENVVNPDYFTEWDTKFFRRTLLAHEFAHAWNGKFRRPADLWTPTYEGPMHDSLMWVYEGLTTYWDRVLAARSGMLTVTQALESLASLAAYQEATVGRAWRSLQDTTLDPIIASRRALPWRTYQRAEDYYPEGSLIWLDADTLIREKTGGHRSLDDFARAFFAGEDRKPGPVTYDFEDLVTAMNTVVAHDWRQFFRTRLNDLNSSAPLDGIERGGYRLAFDSSPSNMFKDNEARLEVSDFRYSLGFMVGKGDALSEVVWGSPAFEAGLTESISLIAVNGEAYEASNLKSAIKRASRPGAEPIELLVKDGNRYRTVKLGYHKGLRFPVLERIPGKRPILDEILVPRP